MFGKHTRFMIFTLLIIITALSLFNCSGEAEDDAIRVGAIVSMTGMNAMTGAEQKWAYEQAVADINNKGGVYVKELDKKMPLKLIFADDKSVPDQGAAAMERVETHRRAAAQRDVSALTHIGRICRHHEVELYGDVRIERLRDRQGAAQVVLFLHREHEMHVR